MSIREGGHTQLEPAYSLYVDHAGSPKVQPHGDPEQSGLVVAAVCVSELARDGIQSLLPRGADDEKPLKFSARDLNPRALETFLDRLLLTDVDLAVVHVGTAEPDTMETAEDVLCFSNRVRRERGNSPIKQQHLLYGLAYKEAIVNAWQLATDRLQSDLRFFGLVLDEESLPPGDRALMCSMWTEVPARHGLVCPEPRWCSEDTEFLLYVPDLVAGTILRQATREDVPGPWRVLDEAAARGRIHIQPGFETRIRLPSGTGQRRAISDGPRAR